MASVSKRDTSRGPRYDVRYRTPSRQVRTKTFKRKVDADRYAREVETDMSRGDWTDPRRGRETFADWWARWWPTTVDLAPSTRARDANYAKNHILPRFGALPLGAIEHTDVAEWVAEMSAKDLAPATVTKAKQILSKTLDAAVDAGLIRSNPSARVKTPKIVQREMRFCTPEEIAALADAIDARYRALVFVGGYCGLRFGELAGLKRDRVDLLHRRLDVIENATEVSGHTIVGRPKTRAGRRTVPVPSVVADVLTEHLGRTPGDLVFPAPAGGYMRRGLFRRRFWLPATAAAGLDGLRPHDLRHTAVSLWIAAGASPKEIAVRAGHSSVSVVLDRYGHLLPGQSDAVDDALDAMARGAAKPNGASVRAMDARWNEK